MAVSAAETVLGASGNVYVAPVGTVFPADEVAVVNTAFKDVGYISEDGATLTDSKEINEYLAWQAVGPIRRAISTRSTSVQFNMLQWNENTLAFAFGGGTVTEPTPSHYKYVPPEPEIIDTRALILEWHDSTFDYRFCIPEGMVTEDVESQLSREALAALPITFAAQDNGVDPVWYLLTDDPSFEVP